MSAIYRRRQKHRINKLHRKKKSIHGKGRAWNKRNKNKKKNIRGKQKKMIHKDKQKR